MIYILELEGGKYYVGKTHNLESRLHAHFSGQGAAWTKLHRPIRVLKTIDTDNEDACTIEMMYKYGIKSVRGGSYSQLILDNVAIESATRAMITQFDLCYKCRKPGHYGSQCRRYCTRCQRTSHYKDQCYASTTRYGVPLPKKDLEQKDMACEDDIDEFILMDTASEDEPESLACHNDIPSISWYEAAVGAMEFVSVLSMDL